MKRTADDARMRRLAHFERLHAQSSDPWHYESAWYERRKRSLTLAMLSRPHYHRIFEPGCSIGVLSAELAPRCDALVCWDFSPSAVAASRRRLAAWPHVSVELGELPLSGKQFDDRFYEPCALAHGFDLIVFSELGYYLEPDALSATIQTLKRALHEEGELVACHWRQPLADGYLSGDEVHARMHETLGLPRISTLTERDFRLDLWSAADPASPPSSSSP